MRVKPIILVSLSLASASALPARAVFAEIVSLAPAADTTIYENATGAFANGRGTAMFAGRNSGTVNSIRRALLRFDVSSIPSDAIISSVVLTLSNSASNVEPEDVALFSLTRAWGEGASTATGAQGGGAPAQPGDATWIHAFSPATLWTAAGGDFVAAPSASTVVTDIGQYQWASAGLIADIARFVQFPAQNFGWEIVGNEAASSSAKRFATREEPSTDLRPVLTITYQVPSPTGAALLLLSAAVFQGRSRPRLSPPR